MENGKSTHRTQIHGIATNDYSRDDINKVGKILSSGGFDVEINSGYFKFSYKL
jgi:hypothetical protein